MEKPDLRVIKMSDNFYGVYEAHFNYPINDYVYRLITSSTTRNGAYKKRKLLYIGYEWGYSGGYR